MRGHSPTANPVRSPTRGSVRPSSGVLRGRVAARAARHGTVARAQRPAGGAARGRRRATRRRGRAPCQISIRRGLMVGSGPRSMAALGESAGRDLSVKRAITGSNPVIRVPPPTMSSNSTGSCQRALHALGRLGTNVAAGRTYAAISARFRTNSGLVGRCPCTDPGHGSTRSRFEPGGLSALASTIVPIRAADSSTRGRSDARGGDPPRSPPRPDLTPDSGRNACACQRRRGRRRGRPCGPRSGRSSRPGRRSRTRCS